MKIYRKIDIKNRQKLIRVVYDLRNFTDIYHMGKIKKYQNKSTKILKKNYKKSKKKVKRKLKKNFKN